MKSDEVRERLLETGWKKTEVGRWTLSIFEVSSLGASGVRCPWEMELSSGLRPETSKHAEELRNAPGQLLSVDLHGLCLLCATRQKNK